MSRCEEDMGEATKDEKHEPEKRLHTVSLIILTAFHSTLSFI